MWKDGVSPADRLVRGSGNRTAGKWYFCTMRQGTARTRVCLNTYGDQDQPLYAYGNCANPCRYPQMQIISQIPVISPNAEQYPLNIEMGSNIPDANIFSTVKLSMGKSIID